MTDKIEEFKESLKSQIEDSYTYIGNLKDEIKKNENTIKREVAFISELERSLHLIESIPVESKK